MIDLDILVGGVEMEALRFVPVLHFMAARQLYTKLHLGRSDTSVACEIAQQVRPSSIHNFLASSSSGAVVPIDATAGGDAHGATRVGTCASRLSSLLKQQHLLGWL